MHLESSPIIPTNRFKGKGLKSRSPIKAHEKSQLSPTRKHRRNKTNRPFGESVILNKDPSIFDQKEETMNRSLNMGILQNLYVQSNSNLKKPTPETALRNSYATFDSINSQSMYGTMHESSHGLAKVKTRKKREESFPGRRLKLVTKARKNLQTKRK